MKTWLKRIAIAALALLLALGAAACLRAACPEYRHTVGTGPGSVTSAQPGELGRWVDLFIGTGGVP